MSMTENEAINHLELCKKSRMFIPNNDVLDIAIQALEDVQQYRALEQKLQSVYGEHDGLLENVVNGLVKYENAPDKIIKAVLLTDEDVDKWEQLKSIGTIEEFEALKEKNEPKKILYRKQSYGTPWLCPYCEADQIKVEFFNEDGSEPKEKYTFCWQCGTRIDWSE